MSPAIRPPAPEGELPAALQAELRAALEQTISDYRVPGAAVGVWLRDRGAWTAAVGLAEIENGVAASTAMTWPLRSITKSYTVTLVLQLVDDGVLSLDHTLDQYVDGVTNADAITLRQLANMSSGNSDYTNESFLEAYTKDPSRIFTLDELNSYVLGRPAQFPPGEKRVYTNANTNLLGAVVESATRERFADVLRERILRPLGQQGTTYVLDPARWTQPHPVGYVNEAGGPEPQSDNLSVFGPAGSMITTLEDGRVWAEILATGTLLKDKTQAERQVGAPLDAGPPYDRYALGMGQTDGWWGHNGEGFGFTAAAFHNVGAGATVVAFMNVSNVLPKAHPADQLFRRIAEIVRAR